MAGTITHSWNGTVLTVTSDSGTSSADLAGTMGPRGPQGPAGVIINGSGTIDMSGYATEKWVNDKIAEVNSGAAIDLTDYYTKSEIDVLLEDLEVDVDLTGYATTGDVAQAVSDKATETYVDNKVAGLASESFVTNKITEAQLGGGESGGGVDLSGYATKDDLNDCATKDDLNTYRKLDNNIFTGELVVSGAGWFSELYTGEQGNRKPVATREWVNNAIANAIAALDGDEVSY